MSETNWILLASMFFSISITFAIIVLGNFGLIPATILSVIGSSIGATIGITIAQKNKKESND